MIAKHITAILLVSDAIEYVTGEQIDKIAKAIKFWPKWTNPLNIIYKDKFLVLLSFYELLSL